MHRTLIKVFSLCFFLMSCASGKEGNNQGAAINASPKVSVQLWSVRDKIKDDFIGTIDAISKMGFDAVELAGNYGPYDNDPEGLKNFLSEKGLVASGAHVGLPQLMKMDETDLAFYTQLGVDLVIIPADSRAWSSEGVEPFVKDLNYLYEKLAKAGLTLCYHNHEKEFNPFKASTYWDYIAQNTPKEMCLQLDVGWVNYAGKSSIEYVKRYPGRTKTTHIKIRTPGFTGVNSIIGQDDYNWKELVSVQASVGGTDWFVIEQEEYPEGYSSLDAVEASRKGFLSELGVSK